MIIEENVINMLYSHGLDLRNIEIDPNTEISFVGYSTNNSAGLSYLKNEKKELILDEKGIDVTKLSSLPQNIRRKYGVTAKPSKVIHYLSGNLFGPQYLNLINSVFLCEELYKHHTISMEVWRGSKLLDAYTYDNYISREETSNIGLKSGGSLLHDSCMNDKHTCLRLYVINPDTVGVVVCLIDGKIIGRALLWNTEQGIAYLDRLYLASEKILFLFYEFAILNKLCCFLSGIGSLDFRKAELPCNFLDFKVESMDLSVMCQDTEKYPYLDTFRYTDDVLNGPGQHIILSNKDGIFSLTSTEGHYYENYGDEDDYDDGENEENNDCIAQDS